MSIDKFFLQRVREASIEVPFSDQEREQLQEVFGRVPGYGSHTCDVIIKSDLLYFRFRKLSQTELAIENINSFEKGQGRLAVESLEKFARLENYQVIKARNIAPKAIGFWEKLGFRQENSEDPNSNYYKAVTV